MKINWIRRDFVVRPLKIGSLRKEGFDHEVAKNIRKLIERVKETGNDGDLRRFCEELVRHKTNEIKVRARR